MGRLMLVYIFTLLTWSTNALDTDTLKISGSQSIQVNAYTRVFHTVKVLEAKEAWNLIQADSIERSAYQTNPGLNYPDAAFWMVLVIKNEFAGVEDFYLELTYPQMDYAALYQIKNDSVIHQYETGDNYAFDHRPVTYRNFLFPISVKKGETSRLLFNFDKRNSVVRFPIVLHEKTAFDKTMAQEQWIHGLYFGLISFIAVLSFLMGFALSSHLFLRYGFYVLMFGLWLFTRLGYSYQYLVGDYPAFNLHLVPLTTAVATVALILYIQSFFETRKYLKKFHLLINGVLIYFGVGFAFWLLFPAKVIEYGNLLLNLRYVVTFIVILFTFVAAIRFYKIDKFRTWVFFSAYTILFLAIFSKLFAEYSITDESAYLFDPMMVGFLIETLVLSVAMAIILKKILHQRSELRLKTEDLEGSISDIQKQLENNSIGFITLRSKAVLPVEDIQYIKSDDHYLEFYLNQKERPEIDRDSISSLIKTLPPHFQQIHRSTILNLHFVKAVYAEKVILKDETELRLSRKYKEDLRQQVSLLNK